MEQTSAREMEREKMRKNINHGAIIQLITSVDVIPYQIMIKYTSHAKNVSMAFVQKIFLNILAATV